MCRDDKSENYLEKTITPTLQMFFFLYLCVVQYAGLKHKTNNARTANEIHHQ